MATASPLIKAGYNKANVANPFTGISDVALVAAGVTDPETRKQLISYGRSGKAKAGSSSASGSLGPAGKKRKAWGSDLDKPLPVKAEEKQAISLDFEEVMEDYVSSFPLKKRRSGLAELHAPAVTPRQKPCHQ